MSDLQFLVFADDATGALEVAAGAAALGLRARVDTVACHQAVDVDCLVFNGQTRLEQTLAATHPAIRHFIDLMRQHPHARVMHKMDSCLRGQWPREIAYLSQEQPFIAVLAAYPAMGRVCRDGDVYVDGQLAHEGASGRDPQNPINTSHVPDYLKPHFADVHLIQSDKAYADFLHQFKGVACIDAKNQDNFSQRLAVLAAADVFVSGPSAVAVGIMAHNMTAAQPAKELPQIRLIICGSAHPRSRTQMKQLSKQCPLRVFTYDACPTDRELAELMSEQIVVIQTPNERVDADCAKELAASARQVLNGEHACLIIGGETVSLIADNDQSIYTLGEAAPGIPYFRMSVGGHAVECISKSGGFGADDCLIDICLEQKKGVPCD